MSLAPSFSTPCFYTFNNQQQNNNNKNINNLYSPQPHYNHSFSTERRRRVTLLHAPKIQQSNKNNLATTTTTITTITTTTRPQQQQQKENDIKTKKKKSVRFQQEDKLENIRLFLKTQKPLAIQQGDPALSLALKYPNWPAKTTLSMRHLPMIRMEQVQSKDQQLVGRCRVANLAFHKHVQVRYTMDYWQSFHETEAMYREPIGSSANTWDRFTFSIDLASYFVRQGRQPITVYLALRYCVNENEYWDNNEGLNYQIDIIPSTLLKEDEEDEQVDPMIKKTTLATIEKEEGEALHRGHSRLLSEQQQKKSSTPTIITTTTTTTTTTATTTPTTFNNTTSTSTHNKKKLGHRYDFGASLSEAKKTPYGVYQFGKGPMMQFSTLKQDNSRYHDFVNKYCFYGNTYSTSPTSSSPLPSSEPICG